MAGIFFIDTAYESPLRFDPGKLFEYSEGMFDTVNSYFILAVSRLKPVGKYIITDAEFRPDLISYDIYSDVQYKWLLMLYNDITTHLQLVNGLELKYPSLSDVESIYVQLNALKKSES